MKANVVKLVPKDDSVVTYSVRQVPIERIRAFAFQPRKWFNTKEITARAESMKALGQQDPVTVEPVLGDTEHDYELINGESRLRSAREAGLTVLWAAVRSVPFSSRVEKHLASLVANFNRSEHTPMEISDALHVQVTEGGMTQTAIARVVGKSLAWVNHYLLLQKLHLELQALMHPSRPKAERLATNTAIELARRSQEEQLKILRLARGSDGKAVLLRKKIRALQACHASVSRHEQVIAGATPSHLAWTLDREVRYRELHRPDPAHVAHLRKGIAEFRALLAARSLR